MWKPKNINCGKELGNSSKAKAKVSACGKDLKYSPGAKVFDNL
jgi:hypothetical protein